MNPPLSLFQSCKRGNLDPRDFFKQRENHVILPSNALAKTRCVSAVFVISVSRLSFACLGLVPFIFFVPVNWQTSRNPFETTHGEYPQTPSFLPKDLLHGATNRRPA